MNGGRPPSDMQWVVCIGRAAERMVAVLDFLWPRLCIKDSRPRHAPNQGSLQHRDRPAQAHGFGTRRSNLNKDKALGISKEEEVRRRSLGGELSFVAFCRRRSHSSASPLATACAAIDRGGSGSGPRSLQSGPRRARRPTWAIFNLLALCVLARSQSRWDGMGLID